MITSGEKKREERKRPIEALSSDNTSCLGRGQGAIVLPDGATNTGTSVRVFLRDFAPLLPVTIFFRQRSSTLRANNLIAQFTVCHTGVFIISRVGPQTYNKSFAKLL